MLPYSRRPCTVIPKCTLGKYVPQDMEASAPRYVRPVCLPESQSEEDGRKKGAGVGGVRKTKKQKPKA